MRRIYLLALVLFVCPRPAQAQETSAAGWIGGGTFGGDAAATVDIGFDVDGHGASMGMGARLRWLAGGGLRTEDWDELSEWVGVLRYFTWVTHPAGEDAGPAEDGDAPVVPADELRGELAIGRLGGATLGHGSVIDGFTTGLDVDHGQVGAQVRAQRGNLGAEALIDDLVSPRIVGVRGHALLQSGVDVGLSAAGDGAVPLMDGNRAVLFL
ncbi:MAG TPA: hypothetical protein VL172_19110, partial [Kofleriaceae bacterium]|nr:hypothetical protein [Kofleriaceae bacterium]